MTTFDSILAVVSMLHEQADVNSATRHFRDRPVLAWTLDRLSDVHSLGGVVILCWSDQYAACDFAAATGASVIDRGPRDPSPALLGITAARKWSDGWRSGLLGTCDFDAGFDASAVESALADHDAALLVDPAAALVDPRLIEDLIADARENPSQELLFTQAAPGLNGVLIRREMVGRLAIAKIHPGRLLTYHPDQHGVDPIGKPGCCPVPTGIARTTDRFKLDSDRQVARFTTAFAGLNGHLRTADAETIGRTLPPDDSPRDVTIEINTRRATSPTYWPGRHLPISRPDMTPAACGLAIERLCEAARGDLRVTLGGVGDPLLHSAVFDVITAAHAAGARSTHVETDLLCDAATVDRLAASGVDVVTVFIPAATDKTYQAVMGVDGFSTVMTNVDRLAKAARGTPLIAVTFVKLPINLGEMEAAYDHWVRRFGHAVIAGPPDYAGRIPDPAVADMSPPRRMPCRRLASRAHVLSDGSVVSCDQDATGSDPLRNWDDVRSLKVLHDQRRWDERPLCAKCREWDRP